MHLVFKEANIESVPRLAWGLDKTLFNPGYHLLKDRRTDVFNFDTRFLSITHPSDFNYTLLPPYRIASTDKVLFNI